MKRLFAAVGFGAVVLADFSALAITTAEPANAVVCARGWRGAGCVGRHGAVGVRRYPYHYRRVVRFRRW